ncbi:hypothetical protein SETIT_1G343300v2 [Setaria italica]|uniref:Uncharacterized protein n=2 Tax=Setaria italica TaxID=4555 RepID=A0A368PT10_SETIT|nr:hypothetical protein SETIT_1G343300v2 [Setaria italica]
MRGPRRARGGRRRRGIRLRPQRQPRPGPEETRMRAVAALVVSPQEPAARSAFTSTSILVNSVMHPALFYSDLPHLEFCCFQSVRANGDVVAELHFHVTMETLLMKYTDSCVRQNQNSEQISAGAPPWRWERNPEKRVTKGRRAITSSRPNTLCCMICKTSKRPRTRLKTIGLMLESMSCPAVGAPRFSLATPVGKQRWRCCLATWLRCAI